MCPPFGLFCSVKYLNFEQKLPIRTARHIFLSRHSEVTKNPYYALSHKESQKKVSTNGLILMCIGVYILYLKINPLAFCCPLLSRLLVQDQQKHIVDYRLSYLYGHLRAFLSRVFLELFPKPVYSTMVTKEFKIYSVKITANTFVNQKIESVHFYSCPQANLSPKFLSLSPKKTGIAHSFRTTFS